jgi:hypothetical protein
MKKYIPLFFILFSLAVSAQEKNAATQQLDLYNDTLKIIVKKLYNSKTDSEKQKWNQQLLTTFEQALNSTNSFDYPFDSINDIARIMSPDKTFRIINWNVPKNDGTQEYFGFIQKKQIEIIKKGLLKKEKTETILLFPLIDKSSEIKNAESYVSDNKKWYGMLYYKIIIKKTKSNTYYTLLAWDGNDKLSSKKIIDVLTFDKNGTPHFGADIFNMGKVHQKRVIFEHAVTCTMSLKYSEKKDSIIFDHLVPPLPQLEGQYQYYCPDLGCDGFGFKHEKWNFCTDINATNEKNEKDKMYVNPLNTSPVRQSNTLIKRGKIKQEKK